MEEAQIVVDVQASPLSESMQLQSSPLSEAPVVVDLKASLQRELDTLWANTDETKNCTIFRTPHNISQSKKDLFEPSVISIGPFHHGQKHYFRALEERKKQFLQDFLSRGDHISLDLCISEMKLLETRARRCYSETFDDLDSNAFVQMMLLDGCFVLEYFAKMFEGENLNTLNEVGWNFYFIGCDLLLLENQIPFFIVEKLYEIGNLNQEDRMYFVKYIPYILLPRPYILPAPQAETPDTIDSIIADPPAEISDPIDSLPDPPAEIHHFIHLCYHYIVPNPEKPVVLSSKSFDLTTMFNANRIKGFLHLFLSKVLKTRSPHSTSRSSSVPLPNSTGNLSSMVIPSATELKQKGLKFIPKSDPKNMLDISFEYGVLKIPRLEINDDTKLIFANLMAFEQSKYGKEDSPFTSFVIFLDNLLNTQNDVTILQECGIVENCLGSEEALTHFINQLTEGGILSEGHYLTELNREVNRYIGSSWNRQRANLIRNYFSSPWAAISLVAAFILLVLTLVQSFFAVFSYVRPPKP